MLTHTEECRGVRSARALRGVHAGKRHKRAVFVLCRVLHRLRLRAGKHGRRHGRVFERRRLLELLDSLFVFRGSGDRADTKRGDLDAAEFFPVGRKLGIQRICDFFCVTGQRAVAKAHLADFRKCGLQCGHEFTLELAVDLVSGIFTLYVAANILVEQNRIDKLIGIFAIAADCDVDIQSHVFIHDTERDRIRGAIFVAKDFLGVEEIDALILRGISAKGESAADDLQRFQNPLAEAAVEQRRLGRLVVYILARLGGEIHDLTLFYNHHELSVIDGDDGTVGDDVVGSLGVRAAFFIDTFLPFGDKNVRSHGLAVKILSPLISQHAADCAGGGG
ncbi:hypothetical protein SDC9_127115 [bioreactor metagenome]|uniref:Uncharacterized protein n=1 Tax=bioreactor metagenome TaxID=1076179 RepID=A0A645CSF5_9ZZZZ